MAHKKGQGTSRNGRDSNAQRLGFKAFGGQLVPGGTIIIRQRGTRVKPGLNVGRGKDDTLFAKITGRIKFLDKGSMGKFVMVEPEAVVAEQLAESGLVTERLWPRIRASLQRRRSCLGIRCPFRGCVAISLGFESRLFRFAEIVSIRPCLSMKLKFESKRATAATAAWRSGGRSSFPAVAPPAE